MNINIRIPLHDFLDFKDLQQQYHICRNSAKLSSSSALFIVCFVSVWQMNYIKVTCVGSWRESAAITLQNYTVKTRYTDELKDVNKSVINMISQCNQTIFLPLCESDLIIS